MKGLRPSALSGIHPMQRPTYGRQLTSAPIPSPTVARSWAGARELLALSIYRWCSNHCGMGCVSGPGAKWPHPSRLIPWAFDMPKELKAVCAPGPGAASSLAAAPVGAAPPVLFAHFASPLAPGPLPLRGSASARRARPPPPGAAPRLIRSACVRASVGRPPWRSLGPAELRAALRSAAGFRWSPLLSACVPVLLRCPAGASQPLF